MSNQESLRLLYIIRHAAAGSRSRWHSSDDLRPITSKGKRQADALSEMYRSRCRRIVSSPYKRCVETVLPLSELSNIEVEEVEYLAEGFDPLDAYGILYDEVLALDEGSAIVACTHGDLMTGFAEILASQGSGIGRDPIMIQKAATIAIDFDNGKVVRSRYVAPPSN